MSQTMSRLRNLNNCATTPDESHDSNVINMPTHSVARPPEYELLLQVMSGSFQVYSACVKGALVMFLELGIAAES